MQQYTNITDTISDMIKITLSDNISIDNDELINIATYINTLITEKMINDENIHCVLKLISNLLKIKYVIDSDNNIFNFQINSFLSSYDLPSSDYDFSESDDSIQSYHFDNDNLITNAGLGTDSVSESETDSASDSARYTASDSDTESDASESVAITNCVDEYSPSSSYETKSILVRHDLKTLCVNKPLSKLSDGDVISLVNIYCSTKFNNPTMAIRLIHKYNIHKTSSYLPIFKYFIDDKQHDQIVLFFEKYIEQNLKILDYNRKVKEFNHKVRSYNEKIKLMKKKFAEFSLITDELKTMTLINNKYPQIKSAVNNITDDYFAEIVAKNERNIIELPNTFIKDIILSAINHNDEDFIKTILSNIANPDPSIVSILNVYFTRCNYEFILTNTRQSKCSCCSTLIPNNVIAERDRHNIMHRIASKITNTTHRHDNGVLLNKSERQVISDKWNEFVKILSKTHFDIVIDGANIGYMNAKGSGDINIKLIQSTIQKIVQSTNKKVLLIMHQRHTSKIKQLVLSNAIAPYLKIYTTPNNVNDDWFWLYGSLYNKCCFLSNDQSRDHGCMVAYQNEIKKWIAVYQVKLDSSPTTLTYIDKINEVLNLQPSPGIYYSDKSLHIISDTEDKLHNCICVDMNVDEN